MKWDKSFCIGCQIIDVQHEELVTHVDGLEKLVEKGITGSQFGDTLKFVVDYARSHFSNEEELMAQISYPEIEKQKQLHNELINFVTSILLDLKVGNPCDPHELVDFLNNWVKEHVLSEDIKIGEYIRLHNLNCDH